MNRPAIFLGLFLAVFLTGVARVSATGSDEVSRESNWSGTRLPDRSAQERAMSLLATSKRWELEQLQQQEVISFGNFEDDYRLIAVIANQVAYALLETRRTAGDEAVVLIRVEAGDPLPNSWVVSEIQTAAVVAKREDVTQRVELFPSS